MATFRLQKCHLRQDRLVPTKDEPVSVSWEDLLNRVAPSKSRNAKLQLRTMKRGTFVGLTKSPDAKERCNFLLHNTNNTGKIDWLLKKDPSFATRLLEVYRIESFTWDSKIEEAGARDE